MELTEEQMENLEAAADAVGGELRVDYSGRGMFGGECVGIEHSGRLGGAFYRLVNDEAFDHPTEDNMGLGLITYWPHLQAPS